MKHEVMTIEQFNALPDSGKRTVIAQDALKWIEQGVLGVQTGRYICTDSNQHDSQVKDLMHSNNFKCDVCAKGALFLSHVGIFNELTVGDLSENDDSEPIVEAMPYFTERQLNMIETAFERHGIVTDGMTINEIVKCEEFGDKWAGDSRGRLIAILNNIISNGGEFKPEIYE